jgi:predicted dehydrogenase/threonine dehydrogenase-like Zn-dependent dehydrogenase
MKQVVQSLKTGELAVFEVPTPSVSGSAVLVRNCASLVSAGTERMLVDFAEKNLIQKARSRPDLVRQTIDKAKREGVLTTIEAVQNRLDKPLPLGYSCAGEVIDVGKGVSGLKPGDFVACSGAGYANHAEAVSVPVSLVARMPEGVDFESAAFTTVGAIALQGVRLAEVRLGEVVAVIGLGLLGQLTVQLLKAAGCVVVGMDLQQSRADLARRAGADAVAWTADEVLSRCQKLSGGKGADAVLITADTKSNQPVELAGELCRDKGVVVAVGAVGMSIPRKVYFEKELDFKISRSTGPGRYDPDYEEKGRDYPYAYVRWTEQRNMQAFLQLLSEGKMDVRPLITHRFGIGEAVRAYELITGKTGEPFLGVLLTYPERPDLSRKTVLSPAAAGRPGAGSADLSKPLDEVRLGMLGAGSFASTTLLAAIKAAGDIKTVGIASANGLSARSAADRHGFDYCTTSGREVLEDAAVNTVAILTRHHLHARQVVDALNSGKHVFVEKPLCLSEGELREVAAAYNSARESSSAAGRQNGGGAPIEPLLMVGYNRRFAPYVVELKRSLASVGEPLMLHYRVNAGYIPLDHWTQDPEQGGGRLLGECCHFIDLLIHFAGSAPRRVTTRALPDNGRYAQDNLLVTVEFENGSLGTVTYVANGDKKFSKEVIEVFGGGLSARLEDFRVLNVKRGVGGLKRTARLRQDKGHKAEWQALAAYLTGKGPHPMPFDEVVTSTAATLSALRSLRNGETVAVEY